MYRYRLSAKWVVKYSPLSLAGLHSHCSSLTALEHTWVTWSTEHDPYFYLHFFHLLITFLNCSLIPAIYMTVADFSTAFYVDIICCCLPEFKVNPPQSQWCWCTVLVLVYVHPYCTKVHLFQPCQGRQSVPCLSTERSAHTSQTNWTSGVKRAQARYGLPSVSAPKVFFSVTFSQHLGC